MSPTRGTPSPLHTPPSMSTQLQNRTLAILATDGFEQSELMQPKADLEAAGATVHVVSLKDGEIKGWDQDDEELERKRQIDAERLLTRLRHAKAFVLIGYCLATIASGVLVFRPLVRRVRTQFDTLEERIEAHTVDLASRSSSSSSIRTS